MKKKTLLKSLFLFLAVSTGLFLRNKKAVKESEKTFPALGRLCSVQGCSMHYFEEGKGDPIVLLHADGGDLYDFYLSPLWNRLTKTNRVIAIDRPGFGYSKRADWKNYSYRNQAIILKETLDLIGVQKPILIGLGESSGIIYSMLLEFPDHFTSALVVNDKISEEKNSLDKLIKLPYVGKFLAWTILPLMAERNYVSANVSRENSEKSRILDTHPDKLFAKAENKDFFDSKELNRLAFLNSNNNNSSLKILNFQTDDDTLFNSLNLGEYFKNKETLEIQNTSSTLEVLKSDKIIEIIKSF